MSKNSFINMQVTVSCVVFGYIENIGMQICLIKRTTKPFLDMWTLPGGYLKVNETLEMAMGRELQYDTGIKQVSLKQFNAFDSKDEPQHIVIGYYGLANTQNQTLMSTIKAKNASWFPVKKLPDLAFNQKYIVAEAFRVMRLDAMNTPTFKSLLPHSFSLLDLRLILQDLFECRFDTSNFRKKIVASGLFEKVGKKKGGVGYCAPELYRFTRMSIGNNMEHKLFGYGSFIGRLISGKFKE